ncbi:MAG: hypothetical protein WA885_08060 [Phormidesmis sp.]
MVNTQTAEVGDGSSLSDELVQRIQQRMALKQDLTDFVMDEEGEVATALESFSAEQLRLWGKPTLAGLNRTELAIDMFLGEGQVGDRAIIDLFLQSRPEFPATQKNWVQQWKGSFNGLFVIRRVSPGGYRLMNWLTQKLYSVRPNDSLASEVTARFDVGEIVLARLLPLGNGEWTFSGPLTLLGKLGKPKLAVAIGNFRKWFPQQLYGDAPELQAAAWESVARQYDEFLEFFGADKVTLSGYELNKKLQAYQAAASERRLADIGIDSSKSLKELAQDTGASAAEMDEAIADVSEENTAAKALLESGQSLKMIMPKVTLPDELKRAEAVTALAHPRWGPAFLPDYSHLESLLSESETADTDELDRMLLKYLQKDQVTLPVWQRLAADYGAPLQAALRRVLGQADFEIEQDLRGVIARHGKPLTPQMPDSASVPQHLHDLFQEALKAVGKSSGKQKKAKKKTGFGR